MTAHESSNEVVVVQHVAGKPVHRIYNSYNQARFARLKPESTREDRQTYLAGGERLCLWALWRGSRASRFELLRRVAQVAAPRGRFVYVALVSFRTGSPYAPQLA